jgi:Icc-related predicted phosphoesterase
VRLGKRNDDARMRIFFATDIHGSERCFRKFLNAGRFYKADHLVLGGDITGKVLVPVIRDRAGYRCDYNDREYRRLTESERAELEGLIRDNGQYPVVGEYDELKTLMDESTREEAFRTAVLEGIGRWVALAEERLRGTGVRCFITPGNDDYTEVEDALQGSDVVEYVEGRCVALDDQHEMITTGYSNITPWRSPRELPEEELHRYVDRMARSVADPAHMIAVLHPPPFGTELDKAPEIDEEFRVQMEGGQPKLTSVGSTAVRAVLEEYQPLLSLHGHVHESRAAQRLGRTTCINPGSEYTTGTLLCAIVSVRGDRVDYQFVAG